MSAQRKEPVNFQLLRRRYQQSCAADEAKRYADPEAVKRGEVSFEQALPIDEWLKLKRAGFRFDEE